MTLPLAANISLLFAELPYLDRPAAAAAAGFDSVESWWPFSSAAPDAAETDALVDALTASGLPLTGLNLFAGDMPAGDRGILSSPGREDEFDTNLEAVAAIAQRTGCRGFNALYGQRLSGARAQEQDDVALRNLATGVRRFAEFGGTLYIEPLSRGRNGAYPIETARQAIEIVTKVRADTGLDNIGMLFDTFHLTNNGEHLPTVIRDFSSMTAHVQLADSPDRGEPGSGSVDFTEVLNELWNSGYRGTVAAEYAPTTTSTRDSLAWIDELPHLRS